MTSMPGLNSAAYDDTSVADCRSLDLAVGRYGTVIAGSSPSYLVGGGFAALFTASAGF